MVTDSVAPRPSAKMLGHIQHPSCVCVCVHMGVYGLVCLCEMQLSTWRMSAPKKCHITHLLMTYIHCTHARQNVYEKRIQMFGRTWHQELFWNAESLTSDVCVCVCVWRCFHSQIPGISCCVRRFVYQYCSFFKKKNLQPSLLHKYSLALDSCDVISCMWSITC